MKISMDKKYRTRSGLDVRLLCVDGDAKQPVVGIVNGRVGKWDDDGAWISKSVTESDLIEYHEPDIRTIWVNVYEETVVPHGDEFTARRDANNSLAISIAQPVTFEVKRS